VNEAIADHGLEVAELFVTLSVSNTSRAFNCRRARATSCSDRPCSRTRSIASIAADSSDGSVVPSMAVSEML
jgi:hypothetical protein